MLSEFGRWDLDKLTITYAVADLEQNRCGGETAKWHVNFIRNTNLYDTKTLENTVYPETYIIRLICPQNIK
jgi:hypothetical protein